MTNLGKVRALNPSQWNEHLPPCPEGSKRSNRQSHWHGRSLKVLRIGIRSTSPFHQRPNEHEDEWPSQEQQLIAHYIREPWDVLHIDSPSVFNILCIPQPRRISLWNAREQSTLVRHQGAYATMAPQPRLGTSTELAEQKGIAARRVNEHGPDVIVDLVIRRCGWGSWVVPVVTCSGEVFSDSADYLGEVFSKLGGCQSPNQVR